MKLISGNIARKLHFTLQTAVKLIQPLNLPFRSCSDLPVHIHKDCSLDNCNQTNDETLTDCCCRCRSGVFHMWLNMFRQTSYRRRVCFLRIIPAMEAQLLLFISMVAFLRGCICEDISKLKKRVISEKKTLKFCSKSTHIPLILQLNRHPGISCRI